MLVYGSKVVRFALNRSTSVPPYSGVPSVSHQFPVEVVVAVTVVAVLVDVVEVGTDVVVVVEVMAAVVGVSVVLDVVVELAHDAKKNDVTKRKVIDTKIIPFFI